MLSRGHGRGAQASPLQETVVLDDNSDTMIELVGKRVIPILMSDDGQTMLESMDMVTYLDSLGERILTGPRSVAKSAPGR